MRGMAGKVLMKPKILCDFIAIQDICCIFATC